MAHFAAPPPCNLTSAQSYHNVDDPSKGGVTFMQKVASGSDTVLFAGHSVQFQKDVVGKLFTNPMYDYELRFYNEIVPRLLQGSTHFIPKIFVAECEQEAQRVLASIPDALKQNLGRRMDARTPPVLRILATLRHPNTSTLGQLLWESKIDAKGCLLIYFQVCAALHFLGAVHATHNDLYVRNVLVVTMSPALFHYKIDDKYYTFASPYYAFMFDWDTAYAESLGPNPQLTAPFCAQQNYCNRFVAGKDLTTFTCDVFGGSQRPVLTAADLRLMFGAQLPQFVQLVESVKRSPLDCRFPTDGPISYAAANPKQVLHVLAPHLGITTKTLPQHFEPSSAF